jgi:hypothetical protein
MNIKRFFFGVVVGALATVPGFASVITLGINGDAQVGPSFMNFGNFPTGSVYTPSPGYGTMIVSQTPGGIFESAGVTAGETGKIQSLSAAMTPPGAILTPDPNSSLPFMTFDTGGSNLELFLTQLVAGNAGPFTLTDTQSGAVASFNINGFVYNKTDGSREDITGTFSATFDGMSVAQLVALGNGPGVETPFSGTLSVADVPEPASLMFLGVGLLAAGLVSKRKPRN